jgi:hypothetical protein
MSVEDESRTAGAQPMLGDLRHDLSLLRFILP